jgi:pyridoxal phosphate enzyme (YggS family)
VQELLEKAQALSNLNIDWHFIGQLQSNKINMLLKTPQLVSIHSIGSIKLLNKLLAKNPGKRIGVFLQVNTSGEDEKSGFESSKELEQGIDLLKEHEDFYFQGLMTIGKIRTESFEEDAINCFNQLVELKHDFSQKNLAQNIELSMGMSSDYPIALKLGSDWIRVGSSIFGSRTL